MSDEPTRFAELTAELFGAKMASELIRDIWANASPETKRELADAILKKIVEDAVSSCNLSWVVRAEMERLAKEYVGGELADKLKEDLKEAIERQWKPRVEDAAVQALGQVLARVAADFKLRW